MRAYIIRELAVFGFYWNSETEQFNQQATDTALASINHKPKTNKLINEQTFDFYKPEKKKLTLRLMYLTGGSRFLLLVRDRTLTT